MTTRSAWSSGRGCLLLLLVASLSSCDDSSGSSPPPESNKIRITSPTTGSAITVSSGAIDLGGWAAIDAWSWDYRVEPCVHWVNATTGAADRAAEHVTWEWLFGYYPVDHTWTATVPLAPGRNYLRVEAYYSDSGTVVGIDTIRVDWR
jgi:hypothetical protein